MKKHSSSPYPDEEIDWCADRIHQQFKTSPERSTELAIQAMSGMDGHGGDPCNRKDMQGVIDVVVKSWINQKINYEPAHGSYLDNARFEGRV